jgi:hypothetical protein
VAVPLLAAVVAVVKLLYVEDVIGDVAYAAAGAEGGAAAGINA